MSEQPYWMELDPQRLVKKIAELFAGIEVQRAVVSRLEELTDDESRSLDRMEDHLREFRAAAAKYLPIGPADPSASSVQSVEPASQGAQQ